jgi:hypothetical protein
VLVVQHTGSWPRRHRFESVTPDQRASGAMVSASARHAEGYWFKSSDAHQSIQGERRNGRSATLSQRTDSPDMDSCPRGEGADCNPAYISSNLIESSIHTRPEVRLAVQEQETAKVYVCEAPQDRKAVGKEVRYFYQGQEEEIMIMP